MSYSCIRRFHIANISFSPELIHRFNSLLKQKASISLLIMLYLSELIFAFQWVSWFTQRFSMIITGESCLGKDIYTMPRYHATDYLLIPKGNTLLQCRGLAVTLLPRNKLSINNGGTVNHDMTHDVMQYEVPNNNYDVFVPTVLNMNLTTLSRLISHLQEIQDIEEKLNNTLHKLSDKSRM